VRAGEGEGDREAETGADARVGRAAREALEQAADELGRNAGPVVADQDTYVRLVYGL